MEQEERFSRIQLITSVFTPATPLRNRDLFCGRVPQIADVIAGIQEPGRHVVLFGERGVGKTSLANILGELLYGASAEIGVSTFRVSVDTSDNFSTIWQKIARRLNGPVKERIGSGADTAIISEEATPGDILELIGSLERATVLIIDEYDRIKDAPTKTLMADTLKGISDGLPSVTVMLVGVARTIHELVGQHQSIQRNLKQVEMPRMSRSEMNEIIDKGMSRLKMAISDDPRSKILDFSAGFPHYVHLMAKHSCLHAINRSGSRVMNEDFGFGLEEALEEVHESVRQSYQAATITSKKRTLFEPILRACSQAAKDEHGTFRPTDVAAIASKIVGSKIEVASVYTTISKLCGEGRGTILEKVGSPKNYRYRFSDPLMEVYIRMRVYQTDQLKNGGRR